MDLRRPELGSPGPEPHNSVTLKPYLRNAPKRRRIKKSSTLNM